MRLYPTDEKLIVCSMLRFNPSKYYGVTRLYIMD